MAELVSAIKDYEIKGYREYSERHPKTSFGNSENKIKEIERFPEKDLAQHYTEDELKSIFNAFQENQDAGKIKTEVSKTDTPQVETSNTETSDKEKTQTKDFSKYGRKK